MSHDARQESNDANPLAPVSGNFLADEACLKLLELYFRSRDPRSGDIQSTAVSFGRFQILRELGSGGCGIVYCARDTQLDRVVALKIPHVHLLHHQDAIERFEREGRAAAAFEHPNLVPVLEVGTAGPIPYLISVYVDGPNLSQWLETNPPLSPRVAATLVAELADGVAYCHARQVLHRDIKPSNVLLAPTEWKLETLGLTPRLTDFGLAKFLEPDATKTAGDVIGTAMYMAPETALGTGEPIGPPADIYSLGAVLYELLAGQPPWRVKSTAELVERLHGPPPNAPSSIRGSVAKDLDLICLRCLRKAPSERYASIRHLLEDLRAFIDGKPLVHILAGPGNPDRWAKARPWLGLGALVISSVSILLGLLHSRTPSLENTASLETATSVENAAPMEYAGPVGNTAVTAEASAQWRDRMNALDAASNSLSRGKLDEAALILRANPTVTAMDDPSGLVAGAEHFLGRQISEWSPLHTFTGGGKAVQSLAVSADGQLLAAGDKIGTVRVWSLQTLQLVKSFQDRDCEIRGLGFSPTRQELAVAGMTGVVNLWQTDEWKLVATRAGGELTVTCLSWREDGDLLMTGDRDGSIELLAWPDLKRIKGWREGDVIDALHLSGSRFWYSCRDHYRISTRSTRDPSTRTDLLKGSRALYGCSVDPSHSFGLCEWGIFKLDGKERVQPSLRRTVRAAAISGDGTWGVAAGSDGFIDLFRWSDPFKRFWCTSFRGHFQSVTAVAVCPDQHRFVSASEDGTVRLWTIDSLSQPTETQCHDLLDGVRDLCTDQHGNRFALIADRGVMFGNERLEHTVRELKEPGNRKVLSAGFHPDGQTLLIHRVLPKSGIEMLNLDQGEPVGFTEIPNLSLASFSQGTGVALVRTGTSPFIECSNASDLTKPVARFETPGQVSAVAYDQAAQLVAYTYRSGGEWHCRVSDSVGGGNRGDWILGPERPEKLLFSAHQARCFVICGDSIGYDIDTVSSELPERLALSEMRWRVVGAACAPDGRTLAFIAKSNRDNASQCFLWDRQTRCRFLTMPMPDALATSVQFMDGGQRLVVGSTSFGETALTSVRSWKLFPPTETVPNQ